MRECAAGANIVKEPRGQLDIEMKAVAGDVPRDRDVAARMRMNASCVRERCGRGRDRHALGRGIDSQHEAVEVDTRSGGPTVTLTFLLAQAAIEGFPKAPGASVGGLRRGWFPPGLLADQVAMGFAALTGKGMAVSPT